MSYPPSRFGDIFHAHGDDIDENDDADIDFDQFFTAFDKNSDDEECEAEQEQPLPPPPLSTATVAEKRPALTPSTPISSSAATTKKKFKPELNKEEQMPKYLSHAEKKFEEIITPLLPRAATTYTVLIEELRQMALLEHELQLVHMDISLWTVYLQSGTGELKKEADHRAAYPSIWPKRLRSIIAADANMHEQENTLLDHSTCLNYVNRMLAQFQEQLRSYQTQKRERKQLLQLNFTPEMEQTIVEFVQEYGLAEQHIVTEGFIAAVEFNYMDRMTELEFQREVSSPEHINVFQTLKKVKTVKETARIEVELLKQRVVHHQLSPFFESFQVPAPAVVETIQDESMRQRLIYRYEQLIQRTKSEIVVLHIRAAEVKMNECNKQFDTDMKQFYEKQRMRDGSAKFTAKMYEIMDRRFKLIDERHQTLLDLKVRFFVKAPTVNKN